MPTYEYECIACNHRFEKFQSMNDEPVKICEKCGKEVRRMFSAPGIMFKGSGFYVNDYKKSSTESSCSKADSKSSSCSGCSASS